MIIDAPPLDATPFTVQYELLRSQVIGEAGDAQQRDLGAPARGAGLALLLREGMPGWLKAIEAVIRASLSSRSARAGEALAPEQSAPCSITQPWLSGVQRRDVTTLLTSLVLSTRRAERSSPEEGYRSCP